VQKYVFSISEQINFRVMYVSKCGLQHVHNKMLSEGVF